MKLERCVENYNTLNDLSNELYVSNKTEEKVTGKNESAFLSKYVPCKYNCKHDGRKIN